MHDVWAVSFLGTTNTLFLRSKNAMCGTMSGLNKQLEYNFNETVPAQHCKRDCISQNTVTEYAIPYHLHTHATHLSYAAFV